MITATRNWFRRYRYPLAVGAGVIGGAYFTGQYILGKLNEARQRMSDDRIAKENLRRRFAQNQEDCTYTVLALLPTLTDNVTTAHPVECLTEELQARRIERVQLSTRSAASSDFGGGPSTSEVPSSSGAGAPGASAEDGQSGSGSFVHASRVGGLGEGGAESASKPSAGKSKAQIWNEIKVSSITRAFTLIYALSLLTLLTRIQLNLLGRRNYLSSVVSLASPPPRKSEDQSPGGISLENREDDENREDYYGTDYDTNRMYLTFSWWLLHRGWVSLRNKVEAAIIEVFGSINPRHEISFERLAACTLEVRRNIEGRTEEERQRHPWLQYLFPNNSDDEQAVLKESGVSPSLEPDQKSYHITPSLRRLLDETSDLIESPTFSHVLTLTLDASFSLLIDEKTATLAFKIPPQNRPDPSPSLDPLFDINPLLRPGSRVTELPEDGESLGRNPSNPKQTSCKLATILAIITRQAHAIGASGDLDSIMAGASTSNGLFDASANAPPPLKKANDYLAAVDGVSDVEAFAAVVYSSNFELEGVDSGNGETRDSSSQESKPVEESLVDVGKELETSLESAWGKATGS